MFIIGGNVNIKWDKYLKKILEDPKSFVEEGAWAAFADNSDDEEE